MPALWQLQSVLGLVLACCWAGPGPSDSDGLGWVPGGREGSWRPVTAARPPVGGAVSPGSRLLGLVAQDWC